MVLWRHGRTTWNASGRFQGQTDIDLDETGRAQAARAAAMLARLEPAVVVASDLRRARDTAAPLGSLTGLEVAVDPGLRETFAGYWQGLTFTEIRERHPEEALAWERGELDFRPGGGETRPEVAARAAAAVRTALAGVPPGGTLVVVSHGGATRVAMCELLGLPQASWTVLGALSNCCWSVLGESRVGWRLLEHNAGTLPEPVLSVEG